jgi:hypothetical protein
MSGVEFAPGFLRSTVLSPGKEKGGGLFAAVSLDCLEQIIQKKCMFKFDADQGFNRVLRRSKSRMVPG